MSGGEVSGGEVSGGEVSGGEMSGGEMSGGEVSGGEIEAGIEPMCIDASQCPVPPPVALVECEDNWVVDVVFTPVCVEGLCDMERSTRQQRDCTVENRICSDGECLTPPPPVECNFETPCSDGELCVYQAGLCGAIGFSEGRGICQAVPSDCAEGTEVCGCDGVIYQSQCAAHSVVVDVSRFGGCHEMAEPSQFSCGQQSCDDQTYCAIFMNDIAGPDQPEFTADCVGIPDVCSGDEAPTCERCFMPDLFLTCADIGEQMIVVYPGG